MPPSPAFRFSPRELNHKRGRSLESGLHLKEKDDDLALFNDMQSREKDNFLLHSSADIDDSFSTKLKQFSEFQLGISIPVRGERSDLLDADAEKNDYDWLLTPPDTPLFPSLDDEPPVVIPVQRGRTRSQPIPISRPSMTEKSYRSSRSSASPHRLSPSPRSSSGTFQPRGRPLSAPHGSPTPLLRTTTPTRRPSTPPDKPLSPAPRSSTPTLRRMSTGSSGNVSATKRSGTSPGKSTRGNSVSPKLRAWQANFPGFSSDPPPNLRTSLSDRPVSHVRGLSPASGSGRDISSSKFRRQSMSPTASRSASSSHSFDRDRLSTQSKGSMASSVDDDMDSLQSVPVNAVERPATRKNGSFSSGTVGLSRKPSKTLSASSAPKRSFDYALRQMDNRKGPQNMFRPLLSSVPSTTFYAGKTYSSSRPMVSRNSSVTTSSNASSELGASFAPDTEGSDHDQGDMPSEWRKAPHADAQEEEIFAFDKVDEMDKDVNLEERRKSSNNDYEGLNKHTRQVKPKDNEKHSIGYFEEATSGTSHVHGNASDVDCGAMIAYCSVCGNEFRTVEPLDADHHICPDCVEKGRISVQKVVDSVNDKPLEASCLREGQTNVRNVKLPERGSYEGVNDQAQIDTVHSHDMLRNRLEEREQSGMDQQTVAPQEVGSSQAGTDSLNHHLPLFTAHQSLKTDEAGGTGISVLLDRSTTSKWPVVQGRAFTATNIHCDGPSYARESPVSLRSNNGLGSASASSSVDWGLLKQTEARFHRQLSLNSRKVDPENFREDLGARFLNTTVSSGISDSTPETFVYARRMSGENFDDSARDLVNSLQEKEGFFRANQGVQIVDVDHKDSLLLNTSFPEDGKVGQSENLRLVDALSDLSKSVETIQLDDTSVAEFVHSDDCDRVRFVGGNSPGSAEDISGVGEAHVDSGASQIDHDTSLSANLDTCNNYGPPLTCEELGTITQETEDSLKGALAPKTEDAASPDPEKTIDAIGGAISALTENDLPVSSSESNLPESSHGVNGEATVTIDRLKGQKSRSMTLEEATETILFCSSIVHNLAYEAATIAIQREQDLVPLEGSRPTVTILGAGSSPRKDPRGRASKRTQKPQKIRPKRLDSKTKIPLGKENNEKPEDEAVNDSSTPTKPDSMRPPKLESKCNCTVM